MTIDIKVPDDYRRYLAVDQENRLLKNTINYLKQEIGKFKEKPLIVCEVKSVVNDRAIIRLHNGNFFYVHILNQLNIKVNDVVLVDQRSFTIIDKLDKNNKYDVENFLLVQKPNASWEDLGGLEEQIKEIKEVVELPLKNPELFKEIGIDPPKGVLLYGASGTGKTLLAKAVASSTNANFIEVIASELNQKFIGEGARLVKEMFQLARDKAPCIIFIDEIDAIGAERIDGTSGERELQRTFMQLLAEMDGFDSLDNVKIIGATNRIDVLDPALLRPGRFDRIIEIPLPDEKARGEILKIHSKKMNLDNVSFEEILKKAEEFTGAELKAICTEAGYFALRENRVKVTNEDFLKAVEKIIGEQDSDDSLAMFG